MPLSALLASAVLSGCADTRHSLELTPLGDGEWILLGTGSAGPVLSHRVPRDGGRGVPRDGDRGRSGAGADRHYVILRDAPAPVQPEPLQLRAERDELRLLRVGDLYFTGDGPGLARAPAGPDRYAFEADGSIWLFTPPDRLTKLSADDDRELLRVRQREGEVILYWAVHPVWSSDGSHVAFISNRESVRGGPEQQTMHIVEVETLRERPLIVAANDAVRTEGALGAEFLFHASRAPGVHAVDWISGMRRKVADGFVLTADSRGRGALIAHGEPHERTVDLHTPAEVRRLPQPDPHFRWSTHARFAPDGRRFLIVASDNQGLYRLVVFLPDTSEPLTLDLPGGPALGPEWTNDSTLVLTTFAHGQPLQGWRVRIR